MNPYTFASIFFGFGFLFVGFFVVLKRNDKIGLLYGLYSFFVVSWAIFFSLLISTGISHEIALLSGRLCCTFALFIAASWLHFCFAFCEYKKNNWLIVFSYSIAFFVACFSFSDWFVPDVAPIMSFDYYTKPGILFHVFTMQFAICVGLGFYILFSSVKSADSLLKKKNLQGLIFASLYGYLGGSLTFFPVYNINCPQYGVFLMPLYPFLLAYFITRNNLLNEFEFIQAARKDKLAAIGTLVTSINHEIKNPLYVIQGLAQSFRQNKAENLYGDKDITIDAAEEVMAKSEAQIQRAVEIMKNFSFFAKQGIDNDVQLKSVSPVNVVARLLPLISYELQLDKIKVVNLISEDSSEVKADERYLEEILFNLIMNSCQAMKQTGGELTLSAKEANDKVLIEIKDNGPGITKEAQKQIFEPFYTTKEEGTGLGLYITKQLVEKIGGKISIESKDAKGAAFRLELNKA